MTDDSINTGTSRRGPTRQSADLRDTIGESMKGTRAPEADGPIHPHELSNDLTEESLPTRTPEEEIAAKSGIGAKPRRLIIVVGGLVLCLVAAGLLGSAVFVGERGYVVVLGAIIAVVGVIIMAMPVLLAAGTKVAQDETVRDIKTSENHERQPSADGPPKARY